MDLGPIHKVHITGLEVPSSWGLGSSLHLPSDHIGIHSTARFTLHYFPLLPFLSSPSTLSSSSSSSSSSALSFISIDKPSHSTPNSRSSIVLPPSLHPLFTRQQEPIPCVALIWHPLPRHSSICPLHPELRANPAHPPHTNPCCIESAV